MKRVASGILLAIVVLLAGCGQERPPEGYTPVLPKAAMKTAECPQFIGDYRPGNSAELPDFFPELPPDRVRDHAFLGIGPDPVGGFRLILRPAPAKLDIQIFEMRLNAPDRYLQWRERVLAAGDPAQADPALLKQIAEIGPSIGFARRLGNQGCNEGWLAVANVREMPQMDSGERPAFDRTASLSLSRGARGDLLIRRSVGETRGTGIHFFGQQITRSSHQFTHWMTYVPVDARVARTKLDADALPLVPSATETAQTKAELQQAFRALDEKLRRYIASGTRIGVLRPVQFDGAALSLTAKVMRVEFGGDYSAKLKRDPFEDILSIDRNISDVEVRKREAGIDGRMRTLIRFSYRYQSQ